jgi:uncharacterized Fe-S cluster-containing radical SAM superfamily protein
MHNNKHINTNAFSRQLRKRSVLLSEKKVLIAKLFDSKQEKDKYTKLNCSGFGRIRYFKNYKLHLRSESTAKIKIKPLLRGHPNVEVLRSQVFQLASCNWRCWYCFVDDDRLAANPDVSKFISAEELLDMYLAEENPPDVIDLSGGEPDLVPEWTFWMMEAMIQKGLAGKVFLWSDDNLSTRFLWDYLSNEQIDFMVNFPLYSRVGCFKGCDAESFVFNTKAGPKQFEEQFSIFKDLLGLGFDMYAYATFTFPKKTDISYVMREFVDRLQYIHPKLPLRTIPLKISLFSAMKTRVTRNMKISLDNQEIAYDAWYSELTKRFTNEELATPYDDISLT